MRAGSRIFRVLMTASDASTSVAVSLAEKLARRGGPERDGTMRSSQKMANRRLDEGAPATSKPGRALPERRSGEDRRSSFDRREMPRPEGRRRNGGRRATDPTEA